MSVENCWIIPLFAVGVFSSDSGSSRIYKGWNSDPRNHPFMVGVVKKASMHGLSHCGASLVSAMTAVTAAHCVFKSRPNEIKLVAGVHSEISQPPTVQERMVDSILIHPQFHKDRTGRNHYDLALVHANAPFLIQGQFTARTIKLPTEPPNTKPRAGFVLSLLGWGYMFGTMLPYILQNGTFIVESDRACNTAFNIRMDMDVFCLSGINGVSSCSGDSGGPLYQIQSGTPVLYGVLSQGSAFCNSSVKSYEAAVNVIHFAQWIRQNSRPNFRRKKL